MKWIIGITTIITTVFLFFDDMSVARYNNANINPSVYKAFKSIQQRCLAKRNKLSEEGLDPSLHLTKRERWVLFKIEYNDWTADYYGDLYDMEWKL